MKVNKICYALTVVFIFIVKASAYDPPMNAEEIKKLPHISAMQAYYLYKQGKIFLLDVHDIPGKKASEIIGAHYFPSKKIKKSKIKLPKKVIIGVF